MIKECPFKPVGTGFGMCHSDCMAYYEVKKEGGTAVETVHRCKRLDGGGSPPPPVDIGFIESRFTGYCMSLVEAEAWEKLARILEAKLELLFCSPVTRKPNPEVKAPAPAEAKEIL